MKRDSRLDLLRVLAIAMIVLMHSPRPTVDAIGYVRTSLSYLTGAGLVLFFMISGSLLLATQESAKEFIRKRFSKILWPTLFWTFFYMAVNFVKEPTGFGSVLRMIGSIPFACQGHGVLWFMYALAGLYLLTPILSRWLNNASKREVEFYLLLWAVTLIYPYLNFVVEINQTETGIFYYFTGFVGYYVFGHYLKYYYQFKWWHVVVAFALAAIIPGLLYASNLEFDYTALWYLSLPMALMAFCWYVMICRLPNKRIPIIEKASSLSFGVYFVHLFINRDIVWNFDWINRLPDVPEIFGLALATFLLSYLVSWLISKLPFSRFIIGV